MRAAIVALALMLPPNALAVEPVEPKTEADVRTETVRRCRSTMGDYGAAMVKACVDQDMAAWRTLSCYPEKHMGVVSRCTRQMGTFGWVVVKACVDQDIEAEEALDDLFGRRDSRSGRA